MRLSISRSAARSAAFSAIVARVFMGLAVEQPGARNGSWLCALIGALAALPWLLCLTRLGREKLLSNRPDIGLLALILFLITLMDAAMVLFSIARTAEYLALDQVPLFWLALPACLSALWCVTRNGETVGYGATLWIRVFPALLILVLLLQTRLFRPGWLWPVLGDGWPGILRGSLRTAGWIVAAASITFVAEPDEQCIPMRRTAGRLLASAGVVILLLLTTLMMYPTPTRHTGWLNRLDALLTNGRAPLYLQLPLIVMWFVALLHLLSSEVFSCSCLAQRLVPALDGRVCGVCIAAATGLIACSKLPETKFASRLALWIFVAVAPLTALAVLIPSNRKGAAQN